MKKDGKRGASSELITLAAMLRNAFEGRLEYLLNTREYSTTMSSRDDDGHDQLERFSAPTRIIFLSIDRKTLYD